MTVSVVSGVDGNANVAFTTNANLTMTVANIATANITNATVTGNLQVSSLKVTTNTVTTTLNVATVIDIFPVTELASAKYFIQANSGSVYHTTEMILVQEEVNAYITEYGTVQTGASLGTFTADINSGNARLLFTPASNNSTTVRSVRYGVQK